MIFLTLYILEFHILRSRESNGKSNSTEDSIPIEANAKEVHLTHGMKAQYGAFPSNSIAPHVVEVSPTYPPKAPKTFIDCT